MGVIESFEMTANDPNVGEEGVPFVYPCFLGEVGVPSIIVLVRAERIEL